MIPANLKGKAERAARKKGMSFGAFMRAALREMLANLEDEGEDPLFDEFLVYDQDTPTDLADKHDDYLYED